MTKKTGNMEQVKKLSNELSEICDLFYCMVDGGYMEYNTHYAEIFLNLIKDNIENLKLEINSFIQKKAG